VDTSHFKGNFPESCSLETYNSSNAQEDLSNLSVDWTALLPRTKLQAHSRHYFDRELLDTGVASHIRFNIYPDGGVSRLRVYGKLVD
jgi:allantoicase